MTITRRGFLKSFSALAACAVAGPTLARLPVSDNARLIAAMQSGLIENQSFVFDGPITLNVSNLVIRNCIFMFRCPYHMKDAITIDGDFLTLDRCDFDVRGSGADCIVRVLPTRTDIGLLNNQTIAFES